MRFKVVIMYDPEYKGYVVDVPELVGWVRNELLNKKAGA